MLLLGALGSGVWEVLRPGFVWFGALMLDLGTLGLKSLVDGMYEEVARGPYERAALNLFAMLTGMVIGLSTFCAAAFALVASEKSLEGKPIEPLLKIRLR